MIFKVEVAVDNAAFTGPDGGDDDYLRDELASVLRQLRIKVTKSAHPQGEAYRLADSNGNTVGTAWFEGDDTGQVYDGCGYIDVDEDDPVAKDAGNPALYTIKRMLRAEQAKVVDHLAAQIAHLGAREEWSMDDNFSCTEGIAALGESLGLPPVGNQTSEALHFYGEADRG